MNDTNKDIGLPLLDQINVYADLGTNHKGNRKLYDRLVNYAISANAIVKIQLFSEKTFNRNWPLPEFWVPSVFCPADLDYALPRKPLALKIASVESTYYELVRECCSTGLPVMISTGGMNEDELLKLCETIDPYSGSVCLMHCVSMYPTPLDLACMSRISLLADIMEDMMIQPYVGWSCHTPEWENLLPIALAYDAKQLEFHLKEDILDNKTPDQQCAVDVENLREITVRTLELQPVFGDSYEDDYVPPDRPDVLEWRKRWSKYV
jgi:sialic acid synthase SpsE